MQGVSVFRDDDARDSVVPIQEPANVVGGISDGSCVNASPDNVTLQRDESTGISSPNADLGERVGEAEITIPVVEEELTVDAVRVARGRVRINKRVETRHESVDVPVTREEVVIEHVPINQFIGDVAPERREEAGVLVIPVIEEVLVVEKRLFLREEIRVSKRRTTTSTPQTIELRREVVDIEREELNSSDPLKDS